MVGPGGVVGARHVYRCVAHRKPCRAMLLCCAPTCTLDGIAVDAQPLAMLNRRQVGVVMITLHLHVAIVVCLCTLGYVFGANCRVRQLRLSNSKFGCVVNASPPTVRSWAMLHIEFVSAGSQVYGCIERLKPKGC